MTTQFNAQVYQNAYLPEGSREVNAIMTITTDLESGGQTVAPSALVASGTPRVFGIICDTSGSMEGVKIQSAKQAIAKVIELLPPDAHFFIVTGSSQPTLLSGLTLATDSAKNTALAALRTVTANRSTAISTWLNLALQQFKLMPGAIAQALLLTDGQNDSSDLNALDKVLNACENQFQCDCRGIGTEWRVAQLQMIARKLLGTADIIADASAMESDFRDILGQAMSKQVSDIALRLWTPQGAKVLFCKQVSPEIVDITNKAKAISGQIVDYPTGAWGNQESRDYHFCIQVNAGNVGDEMLAGRASLVYSQNGVETKVAETRILAIWTDDEVRSAKIDRTVAHYTGQAELAQVIHEGMEARAQGNFDVATAKLSKAVQLSDESGNEATMKLLRKVVDIEDAATGTIRIRREVRKEDEMALETRSTKTTRIKR
jgi:hypothetical protein